MITSEITNRYSNLRIPQINKLGTEALQECLTVELQQRNVWDDELQWAIDYAVSMHENDPRKDGPYPNHILRVGLWAVREFNTFDGELAKAAILHDLAENHPEEVIGELGLDVAPRNVRAWLSAQQDKPESIRQQAVWMLGESGRIANPDTVAAIGNLTCPSYDGLTRPEKNRQYAIHILEKIVKTESGLLVDPIACAGKIADQIDNFNGNRYNPDDKMRHRLDMKYYPLSEPLRNAVTAPNSLIPKAQQDMIVDALENGQAAARLRLIKGSKEVDGVSEDHIETLVENVRQLKKDLQLEEEAA